MRSTGRPWLTLLACVATAGGVNAQVEVPGDAVAGSTPPPAEEPEARETGWRLPPLHLSGTLAYDMRATRAQQEGNSLSQLLTGTIAARSFIYQPWLAQVGATLALTRGWSSGTSNGGSVFAFDGTDASLHERIRTQEQFVTGKARVDLFPVSRFPFEAHVERADSRIDSGLASPFAFRTQNIGLSQRYRPATGDYTLSASYEHQDQSGQLFRGKQDALNGDFNTRWKANELSVGLSHSRAHTDQDGDESRFGSLVARHNYSPSSAMSVNSTMNWTRTEERSREVSSDISVVQANSIGLYRRDGSPLTLTASARALALREHSGNGSLDSAGLTLGANYEFSPNLRLTGTGGFNVNNGDSGEAKSFTGSLGASYQGDSLQIRGFRYDWFGSGSVGASLADGSTTETQRQETVNLQLGHSLSRGLTLGPLSTLTFSASQSLAWSRTRSHPEIEGDPLASSQVLLHTLGTTWQAGDGGRTVYARATYNDSLELGGGHARFRLFNFQLSGSVEFDNRSSLVGNLTYQRTLETPSTLFHTGDLLSGGRTGSSGASGELTFTKQRPFSVPGLRFVSRVRLAQDVLKQPGTLPSLPDRETRLWENRLDWSVGRLETQLALRMSQVDRRRLDSITLRIQRTFGD